MVAAAGDVTVLGAGIGGLSAAIALARTGARVRVVEQAAALGEVGAGIQISRNAMVALEALGLGAAVRAAGLRSGGTVLCDHAGRVVLPVPPPAAGATFYLHRADLIGVLARAAREAGVTFEMGRAAVGIDIAPDHALLRFRDGGVRRADLLIAADGARGPGRRAIEGAGDPRFSGQVAWRAVVPWAAGAGDAVARLAMGPGRHVVTYPLRGGRLMNLVAVEERRDWRDDSWSARGSAAELRARFAGFGGQAGEVIARVGEVHLWALYLHPVARDWWRGPVALLGDAAHPTLPFMAQGACLAIEDAFVLAQEIAAGEGAFARYAARRRARARRVVAMASRNSWRFHLRPPLAGIAQALLRAGGARAAPRIDWIYAHDVTRGD